MTSITKIQRAALEAAARRNDYAAWPIRDSKLNTGSATRVMKELMRKGLVIETSATAKAPIWRESDDGERLMAIITNAGLAAIGLAPVGRKAGPSSPAGKRGPVAAKRVAVAAVSPDGPRMPRAGTKLALLVELLTRGQGATIAELAEATGWQFHTVRGTLAGAITKRFGFVIASAKASERGRVYRATR
jgi:hypothetical protein